MICHFRARFLPLNDFQPLIKSINGYFINLVIRYISIFVNVCHLVFLIFSIISAFKYSRIIMQSTPPIISQF